MGREIKRVALDFDWPMGETWEGFLLPEGEEKPPPEGEGWQVWETVSDGSPVSPVFATADDLIDYLVEGGDYYERQKPPHQRRTPSREAAENFVSIGWVPTGAFISGKHYKDVEIAGAPRTKGKNIKRKKKTRSSTIIRFKGSSWSCNSGSGFFKAVIDVCRMTDGPNPIDLGKCIVKSAKTYGVPSDCDGVVELKKWIEKSSLYVNISNVNLYRKKLVDEVSVYHRMIRKEYLSIGKNMKSSYDDEVRYFDLIKSAPGASFKRPSHPRDETDQEWIFHNWEA